MSKPVKTILIASAALILAGASGFLASAAITSSLFAPSSKTVTVNVGTGVQGPKGDTGPQGPKGDTGPAGPAGTVTDIPCPDGFSPGTLVLNAPGGQTSIYTCIKG